MFVLAVIFVPLAITLMIPPLRRFFFLLLFAWLTSPIGLGVLLAIAGPSMIALAASNPVMAALVWPFFFYIIVVLFRVLFFHTHIVKALSWNWE